MSDIETEIEEFDGDEELPEDIIEILEDVKTATERINEVLRDYSVSVVMSSLSSAIIQAICLTSTDLKEAQTTAENLGVFLVHSVNSADSQGMCGWNQTRQ